MGMLVIPLALSVILAWFTYGLAQRKGRNPWIWTMATLFLVFPIIILMLLPRNSRTGTANGSVA